MGKMFGCLGAGIAGTVVLLVVAVFGIVAALAITAAEDPDASIPPELEAAYRQVGARTGVHWAALAAWDAAVFRFAIPMRSLDSIYAERIQQRLDEKRRQAEEWCRRNPNETRFCPPSPPELTPQEEETAWREAHAEWRMQLTRHIEGHAAALLPEWAAFEKVPELVYGHFMASDRAARAAELFEGYQLLDSLTADEDAIWIDPVEPPPGWVPRDGFAWPVLAPITSRFGMRISPIDGVERLHGGIDLGAETGTAVRASRSGTVAASEWSDVYGLVVILDHGDGYQTLYAHGSALAVTTGQHVAQGQVVSLSGNTGLSTGPHLHFEVHYQGVPIDPLLLLSERHGRE